MYHFPAEKHIVTPELSVTYSYHTNRMPHYHMTCHWHSCYEILHILEGTFPITANMKQYILTSGDYLLIAPDSIHGGIPEDCVYESICFDLSSILMNSPTKSHRIEQLMNGSLLMTTGMVPNNSATTDLLSSIFMHMKENKTESLFFVQGYLIQLTAWMVEHGFCTEPMNPDQHEAERIQISKRVFEYIRNHYTEDITLDQLADTAGMNKRYFCRFFRLNTQMPPIHYLNFYRIEHSCALLDQGDFTISQAAKECGFHDSVYFCKTFHKYMGITPKQYRMKLIAYQSNHRQ